MGGAYSEGGAYWKEGAKSNHYGNLNIVPVVIFSNGGHFFILAPLAVPIDKLKSLS